MYTYAEVKKREVQSKDIPQEQRDDICREIDKIVAAAGNTAPERRIARREIRSWLRFA